MVQAQPRNADPITIKKYANRRLYNTATSSYVTLDHLAQMIKKGEDFVVYDAKSGDDITRSVLTQIIVEEEAKGEALLPTNFLRQLISLYGGNMQWLVPQYLDYSMESFSRNQETLRDYLQDAMGGIFPFKSLEEMGRQNMAMFERTMRMFNPGTEPVKTPSAPAASAPSEEVTSLDELTRKLEELQRQFIRLTEEQKK